jgi:hypothetical protein
MKEKIKKWVDDFIATATAYQSIMGDSKKFGVELCDFSVKKVQIFRGIKILAETLGETTVRVYHSECYDEVYFWFNDFKFFQLVERGVENV